MPRNDPRTTHGWALYDWANSAYVTTTATVLLPTYFARRIVPEAGLVLWGRPYDGQTLWGYVVGLTALVIFVLGPPLGAVADCTAAKKRFLAVFAITGALAATGLAAMGPGDVGATVLLFFVAQTGLVAGIVFYDAFLLEITTPDTIDRVSARGYAYGYLGGGLQFALAFALVGTHGMLGLSADGAVRLAMAAAGLWWLGFSLPALARLPEDGTPEVLPLEDARLPRLLAYTRLGFRRAWHTTRALRGSPPLALFLLAYVLYGNGVMTIIALASVYAAETLKLSTTVILSTFLVVQLVAFVGALGFGALAGRLGARGALLVSLVLWNVVAVAGYFLPEGGSAGFCALGMAVGLVQGGTQSLSRSLYGTMIPPDAPAQYYGVFSVFSKLSATAGPLAFALVTDVTGSARMGILSLIVFFVTGALLLARVRVPAVLR